MSGVERVLVHMGSDKAGSTAIQESLYANHGWYSEHGVHVPVTGLARAAGHPHLFGSIGDPDIVGELADEAVEASTVLLSWEGVHFFDRAKKRDLRRALDQVYPGADLTFVYYVRNQLDLIQSGVLQQIKQQTVPPSAILDLNNPMDEIPQRARRFLFPKSRYFHQRIEEWQRIFPGADFVVRLYDRGRLRNGDILDDFHHVIGLGDHPKPMGPRAMTNASLSAEAAIVLEGMTRLVWNEEDRRRMIDVLVGFGEGSSNYLHDDVRAEILAAYADDNRRLIREFPDAEGVERSLTRARPDIDEAAIESCERFLLRHGEYPTLLRGKIGGTDLSQLNLDEGWELPTDQGAWTSGHRSVIRFRPRSMHFTGFSDGLDLVFDARYHGRRSVTDDVVVNGRHLGPIDLSDHVVHVPLEDLDRTYVVEVVLEHDVRARDRGANGRSLLLQSLAYSVR